MEIEVAEVKHGNADTIRMITHIYFDWSGTLAHRGSKATFVYGKTTAEKCATLRPSAKALLQSLVRKDYTLGLISNTSKPASLFMKSLEECGLRRFFRPTRILNARLPATRVEL